MRPIHLTLSAWGPYKAVCDIAFDRFDGKGLFLITGATGAGKTSVFDAICFALYGDVSGGMREKNSVRSDFADADTQTYVELVMEHGGKTYRIYRNPEYERPKKRKTGNTTYTKERENAILYLPDGKVIEGNQDVNRKIQEILVLNLKQFKQISMIAQGEFSRLLTAPSREKIEIFREIFGTGIYEEFENVLRQRAKNLYAEAAALKNKLEEAARLPALSDEKYQRLTETDNPNFENIYEYLKDAEKEYEKKAKEYSKEYARADKENTVLASKITKAEEHNRQLAKLKECKVRLKESDEQKINMQKLEENLKQAQHAGFIRPLYVELVSFEKKLAEKENDFSENQNQLDRLRAEKKSMGKIFDLREKIKQTIRIVENKEALQKQQKLQESVINQLKNDREALTQQYLLQEKECMEKNHAYEEADFAYKRAAAGIVARMLKEGEPCPVCGSTYHPSPAHAGDDVPDEKQLKELKKQAQSAASRLQQLHGMVVEKTAGYEAEENKYSKLCEALHDEEEKFDENKEYLADFEDLSVNDCYAKLDSIVGRYQKLDGFMGEKESYGEKLKGEIDSDKEALTVIKEDFYTKLSEYGFDCLTQFEENCLSIKEQQKLSDSLQSYNEERRALQELIKQLKGENDEEFEDIAPLKEKAELFKIEKQNLLEEEKKLNICIASIKRTKALIKEKLKDLKTVSGEYAYVKDLDNVANGMNPKRLVFEQYVLASYFEEILRAANIRFLKMTAGRYEMSRMETIGDGRSRDNLEIQIFDYYTGKYRPVKTLSGGESFKASLSLALGMSDVIQSFHGGIRVDTLFIDEGFGTLDGESLDQACETLETLVEKDRLVGIISHVAELRERIQHQIIVHKTGSGSEIQLVV